MLNPKPKSTGKFWHIDSQRVIGTLIVGVFSWLILLALGILPGDFDRGDTPVWVVVAGFGVFWFAGLLLVMQGTRFEQYMGLLTAGSILIGLALILNWGAFGPGYRECTRTISLPFLSVGGEASDTECRVVIGYFAVILDAVLFIVIASRAAVTFGDNFWTRAFLYLGYGLLLLLLLPLALLIAIIMYSKGGGDKLKTSLRKLFYRSDNR